MTIIECRSLTKQYDRQDIPALNLLELSVQQNTVFGFLGPNGAGKTTAIKILTGMMSATSGTAYVAGEKVEVNSLKLRKKIGYLGQEPRMYPWMKGREILLFVGEIFGLTAKENKSRTDEMLEMAGLTEAANKKLSAYSGGMIQRIGIAQALMGKPEVLFLDEPTSALDPIGRKEVLEFIRTLKQNTTIFMSTHILQDVERVCDEVAIIDKGKLIVQDKIHSLMKRYSSKQLEVVFSSESDLETFTENIGSLSVNFAKENDMLKYVLHESTDSIKQEVLNIITKNALSIEKFETREAGLEDVFVKLVAK